MIGWVYETDRDKVKEAQSALDDFYLQDSIDDLTAAKEKESELLDERIQDWEDYLEMLQEKYEEYDRIQEQRLLQDLLNVQSEEEVQALIEKDMLDFAEYMDEHTATFLEDQISGYTAYNTNFDVFLQEYKSNLEALAALKQQELNLLSSNYSGDLTSLTSSGSLSYSTSGTNVNGTGTGTSGTGTGSGSGTSGSSTKTKQVATGEKTIKIDKVSETEFNASKAMEAQYGSYANYEKILESSITTLSAANKQLATAQQNYDKAYKYTQDEGIGEYELKQAETALNDAKALVSYIEKYGTDVYKTVTYSTGTSTGTSTSKTSSTGTGVTTVNSNGIATTKTNDLTNYAYVDINGLTKMSMDSALKDTSLSKYTDTIYTSDGKAYKIAGQNADGTNKLVEIDAAATRNMSSINSAINSSQLNLTPYDVKVDSSWQNTGYTGNSNWDTAKKQAAQSMNIWNSGLSVSEYSDLYDKYGADTISKWADAGVTGSTLRQMSNIGLSLEQFEEVYNKYGMNTFDYLNQGTNANWVKLLSDDTETTISDYTTKLQDSIKSGSTQEIVGNALLRELAAGNQSNFAKTDSILNDVSDKVFEEFNDARNTLTKFDGDLDSIVDYLENKYNLEEEEIKAALETGGYSDPGDGGGKSASEIYKDLVSRGLADNIASLDSSNSGYTQAELTAARDYKIESARNGTIADTTDNSGNKVSDYSKSTETKHNGMESGLLGDIPIDTSKEVIVKALKGEGVFTDDQMNAISNALGLLEDVPQVSDSTYTSLYSLTKGADLSFTSAADNLLNCMTTKCPEFESTVSGSGDTIYDFGGITMNEVNDAQDFFNSLTQAMSNRYNVTKNRR